MSPTSVADAEKTADHLRAELSATLDQLSSNLTPHQLASEAAQAVAERTPDWLKDYWRLARGPVGLGLVGASAASLTLGLLARARRRGR